ncbi:MAG TPA: glycosyltransferase family 4 protein, partial [Actinomycetes bacterium]|nr:glycosyltransferase family 4 protein [Actinomycetes bacterium]
YLAGAGHEVTLVSFVRPEDREADVRLLGEFCSAVETVPLTRSRLADAGYGAQSLVSTMPFLILRDQSSAMDACLRRVTTGQTFDAVHADQLWMAPFAERCQGVSLRVLDQHNAVFKVPARLAANQPNPVLRALLSREAAKLEVFERATFETFDRIVWVSEDDRRAFPVPEGRTRAGHEVIPIAVDPRERRPLRRTRPHRVTFLGGTHWPPNAEGVRWFADHVWPTVAAAVPEAVFTVIGKGALRQLGPARYRSRVDVTGYLPDVESRLAETAAFIVPLKTGAGMRVKILDAWCWALPIVSTSIGAEGIRTEAGENILLADEAGTFADSVIGVLTDPSLAHRLSDHGRATVEALYDWRVVYQAWDRVYA